MIFKPHEVAYLREGHLGRLATIQPDGTPQVSPVGFTYNADLQTIDIRGYRMSRSQKYRNIATNGKGRVRCGRHRVAGSAAGALPRDPRCRGTGPSARRTNWRDRRGNEHCGHPDQAGAG